MITVWNCDDANSAWCHVAHEFAKEDRSTVQPSRCGATYEILHVCLSISNPRERWIVSRRPPINPAFAIAELISLLQGRSDALFLNYWNSELPKYAGMCDNYSGAYGYRLRSHFGYDQIKRAADALVSDPNGRQILLQIWDPTCDMPNTDGSSRAADVPCNTSSMLKIREGKLEWLQLVRSNDMFRGFPYNVIQFTSLQEILAGWIGTGLGTYNHIADSLHAYSSDIESVRTSPWTEAHENNDSLSLDYESSSRALREIERRMEVMIHNSLPQKDLEGITTWNEPPSAYANLLLVLGAFAARKCKHVELADAILTRCTNPVLSQVWSHWTARKRTRRTALQKHC